MIRTLSFACLCATLCTAAALAQDTPEPENLNEESSATAATSSTAWVYVSNRHVGGTADQLQVYDAAPDGKLTPLPGSPFDYGAKSMVVNGKYLLTVNSNRYYLNVFLLESNGEPHWVVTKDVSDFGDCNILGSLVLDHTGATLYAMEFHAGSCTKSLIESFAVNKPKGELMDLGNSGGNNRLHLPVTFIGNNVFAYSASCPEDMNWGIFKFQRSSNGLLTEILTKGGTPTAPSGYFYCPSQTAADPTNHVAMTMQPVNKLTRSPDKPPQLATYTADAYGNLTTTSTAANMPTTSVGTVTYTAMSPSGKLYAVGGTGGLQIFNFNGASPITNYTGLLLTAQVDMFFWDKANHLYAIGSAANKLWVFTVTPTSYSQAPGSPYSINDPHDIIVQPLPRY